MRIAQKTNLNEKILGLFVSGLPQILHKDEHCLLVSSRQAAIPNITAFASANFSPVPQAHALHLPSDVESFLGLSSPAVWCCCWLYESSTIFLVLNYFRPCVSSTFRSSQYRKFTGRIYSGCPAGNLRTFFFGLFVIFPALWEPYVLLRRFATSLSPGKQILVLLLYLEFLHSVFSPVGSRFSVCLLIAFAIFKCLRFTQLYCEVSCCVYWYVAV